MRDELLNGEIFDTLLEAKVLLEGWRRHYNEVRPHSALGYRPPAPLAVEPGPSGLGSGATKHHLITGIAHGGTSLTLLGFVGVRRPNLYFVPA